MMEPIIELVSEHRFNFITYSCKLHKYESFRFE